MQKITLFTANCAGNAKNCDYPNEMEITSIELFRESLARDHVCAKYKGNRRSEANFEYSDCIPMDCDNDHSEDPADWKTPEDVAKAFPNVSFGVGFSRNNMKDKKGRAPRPKFHVYFPIERISDAKLYAARKQQILQRFPWFDSNAKDAARFYFGTPNDEAFFFEGNLTVDKLLHEVILEGNRNAQLSKKAASLIKRYGDTQEAAERFFDAAGGCVPPLPELELNGIWRSAERFGERLAEDEDYISPEDFNPPQELIDFLRRVKPEHNYLYSRTDIGDSRLFADCYKGKARYVPERKSWFCYDKGAWHFDVAGVRVMELCKEFAVALKNYSEDSHDRDYMDHCRRWFSRRVRETLLKDAQSVYFVNQRAFDRDIYAFNCNNGTLHLDTMKFTEHDPDDLITKRSPVDYIPDARCERFELFIDEICSGDKDKAKFLQKALGYALCGDSKYECMFILHGASSRNGKGTLCESVLSVFGDYGCTTNPDTIGEKPGNSQAPSEDVARLAGVRFVNIAEPSKSFLLNAARVKTMTGNDKLNARFLHENSFDFKPQFKLYINTNYLPVITDMTMFRSRRIIVIPFNHKFDEDSQDVELKRIFAKPENQSAILNWLIEGYRLLSEEGLNLPEAVQKAIGDYEYDSDKVTQFVDERLEKCEGYELRNSEVYSEYSHWCLQNGFNVENAKNFNNSMRRLAVIERRRPKGGGGATTLLIGYRFTGRVEPL